MNSQENPDIFVKKRAFQGVLIATKALLRSLHGVVLHSYRVLVGNSLHSHNAFTALTMHELRFYCVHTALTVC